MNLPILFFNFFCFCIIHLTYSSVHHDYYWREYIGRIPEDAIKGGNNTYIGQTYVHGHGIYVFQIFENSPIVEVAAYGYKQSDKLLKILCSKRKEKYTWFKTSSKTFHLDVIKKNLVIGGYDHVDNNKGMLYVGRVLHQFVHRIGSVNGLLGNAEFHYIQERSQQKDEYFEVLVFEARPRIDMRLGSYGKKFCPECPISEYYWKEFFGDIIPYDAVPAGTDGEGRSSYIGQAYIHNHGVYVANVHIGDKVVDLGAYGHKMAEWNVKILCSDYPEALQWLPTSKDSFKIDTNKLQVIVGGWDQVGNGILNIGRVFYQGVLDIGNVTPYKATQLWFLHRKIERPSDLYEVLVYNNNETNPVLAV